MKAAKAKKKPKAVARESIPLPPGCLALLGKAQIAAAIWVSVRSLEGKIAAGLYPPPDMRLGAFDRWRLETHNAWVVAQAAARPKSKE